MITHGYKDPVYKLKIKQKTKATEISSGSLCNNVLNGNISSHSKWYCASFPPTVGMSHLVTLFFFYFYLN